MAIGGSHRPLPNDVTCICLQDGDVIGRCRERSFQLLEEGKLKVMVDPTGLERFRGIESVVDAEEYMLAGKNIGKMLVSF